MNMLDLFSGIGGFHQGFEKAGFDLDWVGFSEIDKYASGVYKYNYPNAKELGDVKSIQSKDLPTIDIITFGSPCQDFSIAGLRSGMQGDRSSLISEAIRLITECRPRIFVWENVKGTFSSNDGQDFWAIIQAFTNIGGYRLEWQLFNTRWFLPQNRERLYLVGTFGDTCRGQVFPIGKDGCGTNTYKRKINVIGTTKRKEAKGTNSRGLVHDSNGIVGALSATDYKQPKQVLIADYRNDEGLRVRKNNISPTLATRKHSQTDISTMPPFVIKDTIQPVLTPNRAEKSQDQHQVKFNYSVQALNETLEKSKLKKDDVKALDLYNRKAQDHAPTLTEPHHNSLRLYDKTKIRRLTPVECMRLQGFPDDWNQYGLIDGNVVNMSDTQRYKQAGNAVTVDVVEAVAKKLISLTNKNDDE